MPLSSVSLSVLIPCGETDGRRNWRFVCSRLLQRLPAAGFVSECPLRGATYAVTAAASPAPRNTLPAGHGAQSPTNKTQFEVETPRLWPPDAKS